MSNKFSKLNTKQNIFLFICLSFSFFIYAYKQKTVSKDIRSINKSLRRTAKLTAPVFIYLNSNQNAQKENDFKEGKTLIIEATIKPLSKTKNLHLHWILPKNTQVLNGKLQHEYSVEENEEINISLEVKVLNKMTSRLKLMAQTKDRNATQSAVKSIFINPDKKQDSLLKKVFSKSEASSKNLIKTRINY